MNGPTAAVVIFFLLMCVKRLLFSLTPLLRYDTHTHSVLVACDCLPRPDIQAGALPCLWFLVAMVAAQPVEWSLVNLTHK